VSVFYNIGIVFYGFLIRITAIFNEKAKLWVVGRKDIFSKIKSQLAAETRPVIWIHCASLGEFEQGRPIIDSLHRELKTYALVLTFFSPSGFEVRKNYPQADYIFYLPLDTSKNAKRFLTLVSPKIVIFVKYEFWLNYLKEIRKRAIPSVLMSAMFRRDQLFFKWYGQFYRQAIFTFQHIFVQDKTSVTLLNNIGVSAVTLAGDTRFDRVAEIAQHATHFPIIEKMVAGKFTLVAGSTWEKDEAIIADFFNRHKDNNLRLILAPHEINRRHLEQIEKQFQEPVLFFTQITEKTALENARVLIIDTIGILSSVYQYGKVVFIGGGFGKGIHNILEAATFGLPVIFGPNYRKFKEAVDLIRLKGGFSVKSAKEFDKIFEDFTNNSVLLTETSHINHSYVISNCGAQKSILDHIFNIQKNI